MRTLLVIFSFKRTLFRVLYKFNTIIRCCIFLTVTIYLIIATGIQLLQIPITFRILHVIKKNKGTSDEYIGDVIVNAVIEFNYGSKKKLLSHSVQMNNVQSSLIINTEIKMK